MRQMPWKESRVLDQRVQFIAELLKGEEFMTVLCGNFEISRKTGYKWQARYRAGGAAALENTSQRPHDHPRTTPQDIVDHILALRCKHPTWRARKLSARLQRLHPKATSGSDFRQKLPSQAFRLTASRCRWSLLNLTRRLPYNPVFSAQILDCLQLAMIHPSSQGNYHELDWIENSRHLVRPLPYPWTIVR
jgi:hypothetical protein